MSVSFLCLDFLKIYFILLSDESAEYDGFYDEDDDADESVLDEEEIVLGNDYSVVDVGRRTTLEDVTFGNNSIQLAQQRYIVQGCKNNSQENGKQK